MPFLLSSDKQVVNAVNQAAWSPGKDLIACLTQDSQLHAYREYPSFQRIWALSFQSKPTTMCWRPDGIRLAVGHEDGSLSIIDAENGNTEMQTRPQTEHGIACLAWASAPLKGSSDARLTHDMWNRFTRHCPWQDNGGVEQANTPAATKGASDNKAPALKQRDFEVMDILCIADTAGDICLAAFGHYTFLKFSLHDVLKTPMDGVVGPTPKCVPQTMLLCPAISRLFITYGMQAETSKAGAGAGTLGMVVCSLDMVGSRLKELHSLLLIATELRHLHSVCKAAMTRMLRAKQSAHSTLLKVFSLFGSEDPSVPAGQNKWEATRDILRHELQALFSRGEVTGQLHVFLTSRPGEHGLKQAARACDAALSAAHAASSQLHSALQSTSFLLEDLHGLLTASPAYVACSLPASEAQATQVKALQLLVRLEALQRNITSTAHLHRVLFQRLATASRNACGSGATPPGADLSSNSGPGEEQHALQTFLQHHFASDALLTEMQGTGSSGQEAAEVFSTDRKPLAPRNIPVALRLMGIALGHPEPDKQPASAPFSSAVDALGQSLQALFSNLPEALSTSVVPQCKLCLSGRSRKHAPCGNAKCMQPHSESDTSSAKGSPPDRVMVSLQVCCTLAQKKTDSVAQIRMEYDPSEPVVGSMCGAVLDVCQHDAKQMVADAHPFQEGALVLLTKATVEEGALSTRRSRGKQSLEGSLSLVPCPFKESVLVPLHSAVQQDVLQEIVSNGGIVKLEDIEGVGSRCTPSGQVNPPLAVSVARGLATVCAEQRITVYDLLDSEEGDDEDDDEEAAAEGPEGDAESGLSESCDADIDGM